jgi:hypothetical protein
MRKLLLILLFLSVVLNRNYAAIGDSKYDSLKYASDDSIKYFIETKLHYGFVIAHHKSMAGLTTGHFPAFEIDVGKQTHGEKSWQPLYKYPAIGLTFWYCNLANSNVLGDVYAVYPYLNFHLYQDNCFQFNFRFGTGLGYLTKRFDRLDNYKNIAIGSHLNAAINLFYEFKWIVLKRLFLSGSIGLSHFSNGVVKTPDLGINIPTVSLGAAYILHNNSCIIPRLDTGSHKMIQKLNIQLFVSGGIKQTYPADGNTYGSYSLSACFLKPLSKKREIGVGLDFFWEFSNISWLEANGINVKHNYEVIRPAVHIGHQFDFSKLSIVTQLGYYIYAMDKSDGPIYTRFALRYFISNKIILNLALLTNFARADFIEWGVGYSLK